MAIPISSPTSTAEAKQAFVSAYERPGYADPWDAVEDYERVQRAAARHPNKGSSALSSIVDLPRGRIRSWADGDGMPDYYHGLQTALENSWIVDEWDDTA